MMSRSRKRVTLRSYRIRRELTSRTKSVIGSIIHFWTKFARTRFLPYVYIFLLHQMTSARFYSSLTRENLSRTEPRGCLTCTNVIRTGNRPSDIPYVRPAYRVLKTIVPESGIYFVTSIVSCTIFHYNYYYLYFT